jgi:hypothetical protein
MAKKGKTGHPGSSGLAQSGGINHTFGGGKGGTAQSKPVTRGRKIGGGTTNAGLHYTTRTEGGNSTLVPKSFSVGGPPPLHGGSAVGKTKKVKVQKPFRGGSTTGTVTGGK